MVCNVRDASGRCVVLGLRVTVEGRSLNEDAPVLDAEVRSDEGDVDLALTAEDRRVALDLAMALRRFRSEQHLAALSRLAAHWRSAR